MNRQLLAAEILQRPLLAVAVVLLMIHGGPSLKAQEATPAEGAAVENAPVDDAAAEGEQATTEATDDPSAIKLPMVDELQPPTLEELLNGPPRDWVILLTNEAIVCEPVTPRPNTLERLAEAYREKEKERRGKTGEELERWKKELDDLHYVYINTPGPPSREFRVLTTKIARIVHHEDHIIAKIDSLLAEKNIPSANELLVRFERQWPDWPGLADRRHSLIFTDATLRVENGDPEAALVLLEELHHQAAEYPGAADLAGRAAETLVHTALAENDPARGRHFLFRLEKISPGNPMFESLAAEYVAKANDLMNQAKTLGQTGKHAEATTMAEQSVGMWPRAVELKAPYKLLAERYQRLRVGVVRLPGTPKATPFDGDAEIRGRRLSENRLFEIDDFQGGIPHYRTSYLDEWEPFDLGRRMRFTLTQTRQPWESQPPLGAAALTAGLTDQIDPASPNYDERLAAYVSTVEFESPFEFSLTFRRVPTRIEPILRNATGVGFHPKLSSEDLPPEAAAPQQAAPGNPLKPVSYNEEGESADFSLMGGFPVASMSDSEVVYRRLRMEPEGLAHYHVAEVIERLYPNHERATRGLLRGDVWMLPDLPDWIIRRLQSDKQVEKDFFIQSYAVPTTHVLQFNPKSRPLEFRELRRALLQSIDRDTLLIDVVLRDADLRREINEHQKLLKENPTDDRVKALELSIRDRRAASHGKVVNTPFPSFSYANSPQLLKQDYDLSAALAMTIAASSQMNGEIPPLRFAVPPEPVAGEVVKKLIAIWKRIGIEVVPVEAGSADAAGWDIAYRTLQMDEPIVELWPFLTVQPHADVADLKPFPDWLKQELIGLDRTSDWNGAVELIQTLHRHIWADVRCIPLWETTGYMVYRKQLRGIPPEPLHCYEQLDRWSLEAWYATETP